MIVSQMNQVFYPQEADRLFGYCTCPEGNADCDWCCVYYHGNPDFEIDKTENAWIEYAKSLRAEAADGS